MAAIRALLGSRRARIPSGLCAFCRSAGGCSCSGAPRYGPSSARIVVACALMSRARSYKSLAAGAPNGVAQKVYRQITPVGVKASIGLTGARSGRVASNIRDQKYSSSNEWGIDEI